MIIEKILKNLTPKKIEKTNKEVLKINLPPEIKKIVDEYKKVGDPNRNEYLWKWIYRGVKVFTQNRVEEKYLNQVLEVKLLLFIFDTLVDDIVDKPNYRNKKLLKEILKVPFERKYIETKKINKKEKENIKYAIKIWKRIFQIIKKFPRYKEFKDIFEYDVYQFLNMYKYSYLLTQNYYLLNKIESHLYFPHVMQGFIHLTLELMCSPSFDLRDLGKLREICWYIQMMARIGNAVSTWEREVNENDFTSDIFPYAIDFGYITVDELLKEKDKTKIIEKIKNFKVEDELLKKWEECYWEIYKISKKIKSVNIKPILKALQKIIFFHLSSRGLK